jgi:IgA Peptidase M64
MRRPARLPALALLAALAAGGRAEEDGPRVRTWLDSGPSEKCLDVVFVGDGYVRTDLGDDGKYWRDVGRYAKRFLEDAPFSWYRTRTNVRAVFVESAEQGCAQDADVTEPRTALRSHFDSAKGRLLVFGDAEALRTAVERGGPADIVFVMVNTERYGGGGTVLRGRKARERPLPAPTFAAQDTTSFLIALHELGHSMAGLADEYADAELVSKRPLPAGGQDLAEANVTLAEFVDPGAKNGLRATTKWAHFAALPGGASRKWAFEGGYYRETGVFHPWAECRMRRHADRFCPVCSEEMSKAIQATLGDPWDDAAWHTAHPLATWK